MIQRIKNIKNIRIKKSAAIIVVALFSVVVVSGSVLYLARSSESESNTKPVKEEIRVEAETKNEIDLDSKIEEPVQIKESALIAVPYTLQGPLDNLSIHEESCEEAAVLMYHYFLEGQITFAGSTVIPPRKANDEMIQMKAWQAANYGSEPDLSIEALGKFMEDYYGYNYQAFKNITPEDIKKQISLGNPVMVPVMTHHLQNSMYGPKTTYHILVIKGYNAQNVITNDAGVRGENQEYSWDILFSAIDAQTPKMGQGREMVVVTK